MEIAVIGEGEVIIRFIDQKGRTLLQEKLVIFGSATVQARRSIALSVGTKSGPMLVAPVLVGQSNPQQRVTFDREQPSRFTHKRCEEIGCTSDIVSDAERGCAAPLAQDTVFQGDDELLARLIREAAHGEVEQRG